ncbi:MAG TPA: hypothetical protein VIY49_19245 [Bryobacteraceae bacterium]
MRTYLTVSGLLAAALLSPAAKRANLSGKVTDNKGARSQTATSPWM